MSLFNPDENVFTDGRKVKWRFFDNPLMYSILAEAKALGTTVMRRILLFSLLLFLPGCSRHSRETNLLGSYRADAEWGSSTLLLKADHTFEQTVSTKSGTFKKVSGEWELDTSGLTDAITFQKKYLWVTHDEKGEEADGAFASVDPTLFGAPEISADPDYGISFRRLK